MLVGVSIAVTVIAAIMCLVDLLDRPVPAENWANEELIYQDMMNGVSLEQQIKYLKQGRYKKDGTEKYAEVRRAVVRCEELTAEAYKRAAQALSG